MTTTLEGGKGSASRPGRYLPPGKTRYPLYRRLGGPQGQSGQVRKISPLPGFDPRTVQPVTSRYNDYATTLLDSNKLPTGCNNFSIYYPDVYLFSWSGQLPARLRTQHYCHHDTMVKPEAATAVIELLMMGGKTPETCWAVSKCQDNKLKNCCIWLVIIWIVWRCTDLQTLNLTWLVHKSSLKPTNS
jgi:hypothetical protein